MKKAWLQRHTTGEDYENNVKATIPAQQNSLSSAQVNVTNDNSDRDDTAKPTSFHSFSISSMAVNSINKKTGKNSIQINFQLIGMCVVCVYESLKKTTSLRLNLLIGSQTSDLYSIQFKSNYVNQHHNTFILIIFCFFFCDFVEQKPNYIQKNR